METTKTLQEAIIYFSNAENCRQFMIESRWEDGIVRCPQCGAAVSTYIEKSKVYFCKVKHPKQKNRWQDESGRPHPRQQRCHGFLHG